MNIITQDNWKNIVLGLLVGLAFALMAFGVWSFFAPLGNAQEAHLEPIRVEGVFVDLNGDGLIDYVVTGDVVLNSGTLNMVTESKEVTVP